MDVRMILEKKTTRVNYKYWDDGKRRESSFQNRPKYKEFNRLMIHKKSLNIFHKS